MEIERIRSAFQEIWGYKEFRYPQGEIIQTILAQKDALAVMPTGGGKSICFQLPALLQTGITLVISPLVALMENQVQELRDRQLNAATLHSQLSTSQRKQVLQQLERQNLRLLYLSPETLLSDPVWQRLCLPKLNINALILDEAHCLVQWGDSFRPAYRRLGAVRPALLQHKPKGTQLAIAAFTATADPRSQQMIQQTLNLRNPEKFILNPYRKNLYLKIKIAWSPRGRREQMRNFIRTRNGQSGLVYVRTRRDSEELARWLQQKGCKTAAYHAGLSPEERRHIENQWLRDRLQSVVCTSAFGMGINKPNVRWIVHFHPPLLLSEYLQEIGRAGRDGKQATALTLISEPTGWLDPGDKQRYNYFCKNQRSQQQLARTLAKILPKQGDLREISQHHKQAPLALSLLHGNEQLEWHSPFHYQILPTPSSHPASNRQGIQVMQQYLITCQCRWKFLLQAFGHKTDKHYRCLHCDRCQWKIG
ncbi:RecQ family ATP-dependent DNA helicase [Roseofilum casamattae]|uniref:ATP-dependent DNA helicase RecQ n=1 Tax=Roseofilum casamattae BLCC-M143 TaxID=3022442 RepID=A0ABT7C205_9CYAN|nr:ATP-dependent DNA helicase RecQ [Roseofilum casamattae]MDJ1185487.1 ATP-dependent DNA helicase [Roseofilum casamattae BLCC-M143]